MTSLIPEDPLKKERAEAFASINRFANESSLLIDVDAEEAAAASLAYWKSRHKVLSPEECSNLMSLAMEDSQRMHAEALEDEFRREVRHGMIADLCAALLPPMGMGLIVWAFVHFSGIGISMQIIACAALVILSISLIEWRNITQCRTKPKHDKNILPFGTAISFPSHSLGSLMIGSLLFFVAGSTIVQISEHKKVLEENLLLEEMARVDAAVALTIAAQYREPSEHQKISSIVEDTTGLSWSITPTHSGGAIVHASTTASKARAAFSYVGTIDPEVGIVRSNLEFAGKNTELLYIYGKIVEPPSNRSDDFRHVTLQLSNGERRVYRLPNNSLAPPPDTIVFARDTGGNSLENIKSVNELRGGLLARPSSKQLEQRNFSKNEASSAQRVFR